MTLRFIIGRAGTGKTHRCLSEIVEKAQRDSSAYLIYLVPEQATFQREKAILERHPAGGLMNIQVLSFQRLSWRVLQETGGGLFPPLNETGKILILRRIVEIHKEKFRAFGRVIEQPGFLETLAKAISEFKLYAVSPEFLEMGLEHEEIKRHPSLPDKLAELALIYKEFEAYIKNQYIDTDDYLSLLAKNLHRASFLRNSEVWVDEFHGFTPQEYHVLAELLLLCTRVNVTVCLDEEHTRKLLPETHCFYPPWETYQKLRQLAYEVNCPVEKDDCLDFSGEHRFSRRRDLAFLESSFLAEKKVARPPGAGLKLVAAANRRAEIEGVAREIIRLCREEGYRYQDMAVLLRDFSQYELLLPAIFADYEIPYFLDMKRPVQHHPLLELLRAALEVVEKGWNYDPVFRYLKTDLVSISRQDVDLLENYCLAHGIRGARWTDGRPWQYRRSLTLGEESELTQGEEMELQRLNKARERASKALLALQNRCKNSHTALDYCFNLFRLLEDLGVAWKLELWGKKAEEAGRLEEAKLHAQVWDKVIELLDQTAEVLGKEQLTIAEFSQVFNSGLEGLQLGLIPPGLDQVLVGSLERFRNPDLKAVFVLGVNEGVLPARSLEEGLFFDDERKALAGIGISLAPGSEKRLYGEQFLIYLALTRASDFLWVSYPMADGDGKALAPSPLIDRFRELFTLGEEKIGLTVCSVEPTGDHDEDYVVHPHRTLGYLAAVLRQAVEGKLVNPLWWHVYNWYIGQKEWHKPLSMVVNGLYHVNREERISREQARKIYGTTLHTSVSRLERFKACPFAHFLAYGLKLKARPEFKLGAPDLGQFFHKALERFYQYLQAHGLEWAQLTMEQTREITEMIIDELIPQLQNELLLSTARYRYLTGKLKRIVLRAVWVLQEHARRGTFRPLGVEITFGREGALPGLQLTLADGSTIVLQGRIDRVDGAPGAKGYYLRVIDFKSGSTSLSLLEIFYGLKLQLLAYLDVVLTHAPHLIEGEAHPGGVLYFTIRDPFITEKGPLSAAEIEKKILRELKMKGYLLKDPEVIKMMDAEISGHSDLIPVSLNKEQEFYQGTSNALTLEEFTKLRRHVEKILEEIGQEIMEGDVRIQPYQYKGKRPCAYCLYAGICRFDLSVLGNSYRVIKEKEAEEIWYEIGLKEVAGDGETHLDQGTGDGHLLQR